MRQTKARFIPRPRSLTHLLTAALTFGLASAAISGVPPDGPDGLPDDLVDGPDPTGPFLLEISPGSNLDRRAQYVALDVTGLPIGPSLRGFSLRSDDFEGNPLGLIADLSAADLDGRGVLLVATGVAQRAYGVLADVTSSLAAIPEGSGRVCLWDDVGPLDCVTFGFFIGDEAEVGLHAPTLNRGLSLVRVGHTGFGFQDFVLEIADPTPFGLDPGAVPPVPRDAPDPADPAPLPRQPPRDGVIIYEPSPDVPSTQVPGERPACAAAPTSGGLGALGLLGACLALWFLRRRR